MGHFMKPSTLAAIELSYEVKVTFSSSVPPEETSSRENINAYRAVRGIHDRHSAEVTLRGNETGA